jgi:hypothetical protein
MDSASPGVVCQGDIFCYRRAAVLTKVVQLSPSTGDSYRHTGHWSPFAPCILNHRGAGTANKSGILPGRADCATLLVSKAPPPASLPPGFNKHIHYRRTLNQFAEPLQVNYAPAHASNRALRTARECPW